MRKFLAILTLAILTAGCSNGSSGIGGALSDLISGVTGSTAGSGSGSSALAHTPEPSTVALLGVGLAGLAAVMARKKKK